MPPQKKLMLWINLLGGAAVLGSYIVGLMRHAGYAEIFWGNFPTALRPYSTLNMFFAAAGYFCFTYFLFCRVDAANTRLGKRLGFELFNALYVAILLPSALWMPLTSAQSSNFEPALWIFIRVLLAIVGAAAIGILAALLVLSPRQRSMPYWIAVAGTVPFILQTAIFDAILWSCFYL